MSRPTVGFRLASASRLKAIVDALKELVQEAQLACSPRGLTMQAMDPAHCALSMLELPAEDFELFWCDRPMVLGLSIEHLGLVLKGATAVDALELRAQFDADVVQIALLGPREARYELRLMTIDVEDIGFPDTPLSCTASLVSTELRQVFMDIKDFGDEVALSAQGTKLVLTCRGDLGSVVLTLPTLTLAAQPEPFSFNYAMAYMVKFMRDFFLPRI